MNKVVLHKAIALFGEKNQIGKAIEELIELLSELSQPKKTTKFTMADEIADVTIMLEQIKIIFGCEELVEERIKFKLDRLRGLVKEGLKNE